jgi:hypothetical protein
MSYAEASYMHVLSCRISIASNHALDARDDEEDTRPFVSHLHCKQPRVSVSCMSRCMPRMLRNTFATH